MCYDGLWPVGQGPDYVAVIPSRIAILGLASVEPLCAHVRPGQSRPRPPSSTAQRSYISNYTPNPELTSLKIFH